MKRVRVTIHPGDADLPHTFEAVTGDEEEFAAVEVYNWNVTSSRAAFLLGVSGDLDRFEAALGADPGVETYELLPVSDTESYCFVTGRGTDAARALWETFKRGSLMTVPPATWNADGSYTFTVVGRAGDVQRAVESVPDGARVEIESVGASTVTSERVCDRLSDRQREAVEAAIDLGYYDSPRAATTSDVAGALDCATATAAEHLRKAEATLIVGLFRD